MKYAPYTGMAAALLLILCCFFPLAYFPDLQENFTGFYSRQNAYGKPGIALMFLGITDNCFFPDSNTMGQKDESLFGRTGFYVCTENFYSFFEMLLFHLPADQTGPDWYYDFFCCYSRVKPALQSQDE